MKILFSPSEGKRISEIVSDKNDFDFLDTLISKGSVIRKNIAKYMEILNEDDNVISKLFGVKNLNSKCVLDEMLLCSNLGRTSKMQAIRLYSGVAYKALDFQTLPIKAQNYILENVFIFSNLFGMVRSSDLLPFYKCNQNFKYQDFGLNNFYKKLSPKIDELLENESILDLRAEVYIKAYRLKFKHTRVEFLKNGKKVSHYAKHYRGIYLRELSLSPDVRLENLQIENLQFIGSKTLENANILLYEVG
ncbi:hypothetical protein BKH41_04000 [Helicobacter sp. 12S02232-10]|uniref:peroxide stress protein YaaA n=1 Tax=Helicobacter sp. 12S02232-10 TaxID=1476197 RepID=UPI000BA79858|nr:peroxide stress protein YaaA [Helicobacter sp. 12S02232-10]PAF49250.1 hypothetical protein BKH41_04000 [Helicobacter sp. 12S02232-10]